MSSGIASRGTLRTLPRTRVSGTGFGDSPVALRPQRQRCSQLVRNATEPNKDDRTKVAVAGQNVPLRQEKPKLWLAFLAANLSVYAAGIFIALTVSNEASNEFFLSLAKINSEVVAGEYWRLLTATFMHAGLLHLGTNCGSLWAVAPEAEAVYGKGYFAAIFLLTGVAGNVASFMLGDLVTVGASGSIFGLLGALFAYFLRNRALAQSGPQLLLISSLLAFNIVLGLDEGGMVDNSGHLAGFAAGVWLGWSTCPQWKLIPKNEPPKKAFDWSSPNAPGPAGAAPPLPPPEPEAPAKPATPTIALLDTLLDIPEPTPPKREPAPEPPAAASSQASETGGSNTGGAGGGTESAGEGEQEQFSTSGAADAIDMSRPRLGASVLVSFGVSLVVLTWAGCVANSGGSLPL